MTDFRNFRPGHDLRSQLGLATGGFTERMGELIEVKPQDPATAKPSKLANDVRVTVTVNSDQLADTALDAKLKAIVSAGCTSAHKARRISKHYDGLGINVGLAEPEAKVVWTESAETRLQAWCKGMGLDFGKCDPKDMQAVYSALQLIDLSWPMNAPEPGKTIPMVTNYKPNYAGKVSEMDNEVADLMATLIDRGAKTDLIHTAREKFNEAFSLLTESLKGQ